MIPLRWFGSTSALTTTAAVTLALSACGAPAPTVTAATSPEVRPSSSLPVSEPSRPPGEIPAPAQRTPGSTPSSAPAPPSASPSTVPDRPSAEATPSSSAPASPSTERPELSDPESVLVVVNKRRPLDPIDFSPSGLVLPAVPLAVAEPNALLRADTSAALEDMFAAAADDGVSLTLLSGYRSYQDQVSTYQHWVDQNGGSVEAADRISARAGYSEHQTGLAFDVGQADGACALQTCFASTPGGEWMTANAHRFGFIQRYPDGGETTTGFASESWHYRFVGPDVAGAMKERGITTLEEYAGLPAAPGY